MSASQKLNQSFAIAIIASAWIRRQPLWLLQGAIYAVGFIVTLLAWGGSEALRNLAVAYVLIGPWTQGANIVAQLIGWGRGQREFERLVASPVTLPVYFLGMTLGTLPYMLISLAPAFVLVALMNINVLLFARLLVLVPIALVLGTFLSLTVILRVKNPTSISAITNPLVTLTVALPPIYYPISVLPPVLQMLSLAIPTVALMQIARWMMGFYAVSLPQIPIAFVGVWVSVTAFLILRKLKWGLE